MRHLFALNKSISFFKPDCKTSNQLLVLETVTFWDSVKKTKSNPLSFKLSLETGKTKRKRGVRNSELA